MKDAYTLDRDEAGLDEQYRALRNTYVRIFERCQLPVLAVAADVGMMGGSEAHEFIYFNPIGEDTIVICRSCGYAHNRQVARAAKPTPVAEDALPMVRVATPGANTIADLCAMLGVPPERTAKAVFVTTSDGRPVVAIVRGDTQLNDTKLANLVHAAELRPMTAEEIEDIGCVAGYASPIGVAPRYRGRRRSCGAEPQPCGRGERGGMAPPQRQRRAGLPTRPYLRPHGRRRRPGMHQLWGFAPYTTRR